MKCMWGRGECVSVRGWETAMFFSWQVTKYSYKTDLWINAYINSIRNVYNFNYHSRCIDILFVFILTGAKRLMKDIEHMVGFKLYMHWYVCWMVITPVLLIVSHSFPYSSLLDLPHCLLSKGRKQKNGIFSCKIMPSQCSQCQRAGAFLNMHVKKPISYADNLHGYPSDIVVTVQWDDYAGAAPYVTYVHNI